jgi:hypothetical protein
VNGTLRDSESLNVPFTAFEPGPLSAGRRAVRYAGRMFWLTWKTFSGSYRRLTSASRS